MKTFSLLPSQIAAWRRRSLMLQLVIMLVVSAVVLVPQASTLSMMSVAPLGIVFVLFAFVAYRAIRQNEAALQSIRVELGDDYIARSQLRIPQVRIMRSEVTSIEETTSGLFVRTADPRRSLGIPAHLTDNGFQEISAALSTWSLIKPKQAGRNWRGIALAAIVLIGCAAVVFSPWLWLELLAGAGLTTLSGWNYWQLRQSEGVDPKFRRNALFVSILLGVMTVLLAGRYLVVR